MESRKELTVFKGHKEAVNSVAFSPDGRRIVSASGSLSIYSSDNTVRLWDASSGNELAVLKHKDTVNSAVFSFDGRRIVSASDDTTIRLWDTENHQELAILKGHEYGVLNAVFSPDSKIIVSASRDQTVRLWDAASGNELAVLRHKDTVNSAVFSLDGRRIVSASGETVAEEGSGNDSTVRLWDVRQYTFLHDSELYRPFIEAIKFLWQLDVHVQGLEIVHKERTPEDMEKYGSLLAPPTPGQNKFDQVLEWAEQQQSKKK